MGDPGRAESTSGDDAARGGAEQRYRALLECVHDGVLVLDGRGTIVEANRRAGEITGRTEASLLGLHYAQILPSADRDESLQRFAALMSSGVSRNTERPIERPDGSRVLVDVTNRRIEIGNEAYVLSILTDVSEQRAAEAGLRSSERRYRELFVGNAAGVFRATVEGEILECNPAFARIFGFAEAADLRGRSCSSLYFDAAERDELIERTRAAGSVANFSVRGRRRDGSEVAVLVAASLVSVDEQELLEGTVLDVDEERRAKLALVEAELQLRTLVESVRAVLWRADATSLRFTYVSPGAEALLGFPRSRWLEEASFWADRIHPDDRERAVALCRRETAAGRDHSFEYRMVRADGQVVWLHDSAAVIREEGEPVALVGVLVDLTERRQLEEQFRQAQKMEAVGQLAGGVAHDFNNLMGVVLGYTEMLLAEAPDGREEQERLHRIRESTERAVGLTRQLLAFSRKQVMETRVLELNPLIAEFEILLRRVLGDDIELQTALASEVWPVRADATQLEQVVLNLAVNARDAMPRGGILRIETSNIRLDDTRAAIRLGARPGEFVRLSVRDSGCGMDESTRTHAFEPFFTTKETGRGTGLGLATVHGIVRQMDGYIHVESEPGSGSEFTVLLPRSRELPAVQSRAEPAPTATGGSESVLLVEDSDALRHLIARQLRAGGYRVIEVAGASAALELPAEVLAGVDLLLSDVELPDLSGPEMAQGLLARHPRLRFLFMSGYSEQVIHQEGPVRLPFLQKPFTAAVLLCRVREILAGDQDVRPR